MMTDKTENLVKDLCADLKPVKRTSCIFKRLLPLFVAALICTTMGVFYFGIRHDIDQRMTHAPLFILENILMLLAGAGAAVVAVQLSTPRLKVTRSTWLIGASAVLIWLGLCLHAFISTPFEDIQKSLSSSPPCLLDLMVLGAIPSLILLIILRQAAPIKTGLAGFVALLAAASFAAIGSRYICSMESFSHLFVWHFIPVFLMGVLGIVIGKVFLKW